MKITIIGWYGTETIGDRAILAGMFYLFKEIFDVFEVELGCLNPLLSKRTLMEDIIFYRKISDYCNLNISLFDSRLKRNLDKSVGWADYVMIGGGPLMSIQEMYMLKYAFQKARKEKKITVAFGCGMGPFSNYEFARLACDIIDIADLAVFRDQKSLQIYNRVSGTNKNVFCSIDPAVFTAFYYKNEVKYKKSSNDRYIACNFREPTSEYLGNDNNTEVFFLHEIEKMNEVFEIPIKLIPMHSFYMGGDDRYFLNKLKRLSDISTIFVHNIPPSLEDVLRLYYEADVCVGMRFHSILLQTILNGNNYIYDYTDPENGKIINLLRQLDIVQDYQNRYYSLVNNKGSMSFCPENCKIEISQESIQKFKAIYLNSFRLI